MRFPHFLSYCLSTPWAMEPGAMQTYAAMLMRAYARKAGVVAYEDGDPAAEPVAKASGSGRRAAPAIALVNVFGTIMQRAADFGPCEGGTGCEDIGQAIDAAMADETVGQILMRFSSPGGSVFGVQELGDKIRAARATKPICGIADSMAGSAAYWLLAQCSEAYVTPAGMVGSIGVYTAHEDVSKAMDEAGVKMTFVSAGKYKVEGNPFEPLGEEAQAEMQGRVDTYYKAFTSAVAKGRGVGIDQVRDNMGQGRMLLADAALSAGMVDGVMTFEQLVKKMSTGSRSASRARAQALAAADIAGVQ